MSEKFFAIYSVCYIGVRYVEDFFKVLNIIWPFPENVSVTCKCPLQSMSPI